MLRQLNGWLLTLLGMVTVSLGAWALIADWRVDPHPPEPHHDMAGPTDFSDVTARDLAPLVIGVIALGCVLLGLGWWLRRAKAPRLPEARIDR